ncbi:PGPGW domain-containing protein [Nocardioides sp. ChNu-153]|uniref:PGPGW domain-containing protein n=1 Tax=Nocardioides sp. ChNu-153 TaxID=2779364 RepID=UPI00264C533F|nr:PGPGW domain-containing protein [Nocardioides sp. ChNu-153]MDN7121113.1 PGPGW domain-containing protein [Nocardioides sp. ChNu-153]
MRGATKRIVVEVAGWTLVVAGIAALVLPGPGLLMLFGGLAVLSQQYEWAERRLAPVERAAMRAAAEGVETVPRIVLSCLGAVWLLGLGVLWIVGPPAPSWWPVRDSWWLIGGLGTGITLVASAAIAAGLIVYSIRRFRGPGSQRARAAVDAPGDPADPARRTAPVDPGGPAGR